MTARRIADFVLYIIISLALGLVLFVFAYRDIDFKWFALIFETALVFGTSIARQKSR